MAFLLMLGIPVVVAGTWLGLALVSDRLSKYIPASVKRWGAPLIAWGLWTLMWAIVLS